MVCILERGITIVQEYVWLRKLDLFFFCFVILFYQLKERWMKLGEVLKAKVISTSLSFLLLLL